MSEPTLGDLGSEERSNGLPTDVRAWIEAASASRVVRAARHFSGASREAWNLEVERGPVRRSLFLLRDKGEGGGSARDAGVLRALAGTAVPVPEVIGLCEAPSMVLLERIPGRSDFPNVDQEAEREPTARHLMELTANLHSLDPESLEIPHLDLPKSPAEAAESSLSQARGALRMLGVRADPLFGFALDWLEANVPREATQVALVHSDMGPGNFLYEGGRVTGIVDWEVAHFGDPMEDLAAIAVRDMATPIGPLPTRFREYERAAGARVELRRVDYFRALILVRNSLMIGLGLAHPAPGFDVVEMTMYQTLLMRAAALVLCDNLALERPSAASALPKSRGRAGDDRNSDCAEMNRSTFLASLGGDLEREVAPAIEDPAAARALASIRRGLAMLEHESRVGSALGVEEARELRELLARLGAESADGLEPVELDDALRRRLEEWADDPRHSADVACYFARRMHRLAERHRPLMGDLFARLPQHLPDCLELE